MKKVDTYPHCFIKYLDNIYSCSYDELDIFCGYNTKFIRYDNRPVTFCERKENTIGWIVWDECEHEKSFNKRKRGLFSDFFCITRLDSARYSISLVKKPVV